VRTARSEAGTPFRALILHSDLGGEARDDAETGAADSYVTTVSLPSWPPELLPGDVSIHPLAALSVASASRTLGARASCVWSSSAEAMTPLAIQCFLRATEGKGYDLAVPRYTQPKFGSLINSGIIAPLTRTLYGPGIPYPMARDFSFSPRLVDELLRPDPKTGRPRPPEWIPMQAVCQGLRLCLVELGLVPPSISGSADLSSVLSRVLGSLFQNLENNASYWQRTRGPQVLPKFGQTAVAPESQGVFEVQGMIEGFHLAYRNLGEIWGLALPPATLLELKKLNTAATAEFRLADTSWARIVYDFALAQKQRVMNRDHLLRALTPIYLAWVASYAIEVGNAPTAQAFNRLEQLAQAYEAQKPYLLSRWRWPDRFSP